MDPVMLQLCGSFLSMKVVQDHTKHLGLSVQVGKNKKVALRNMEDKFQSKIQGWKSLLLSTAGKETLIKSVLQATPLYTMSVFKLPKTLCNQLSSTIKRFWWSRNSQSV